MIVTWCEMNARSRVICSRLPTACFVVLALLSGGTAAAADAGMVECGDPFSNGVGPYDYNNAEDRSNPQKIPIVEKFHFTQVVESLARGSSSEYAMVDLDYTLRAVPNHHRALNAVARFDVEKGGIPPRWHSAQCWFDRATQFRPEDAQVWLIYANWMARKGEHDDALEAYQQAKTLAPESVEIDYNMGLLYFKMGEYEKSLASARLAYAGNYPLQGLRRKLAERGYSVDN
jgi:tetratricopeptide (TPR) repeat protein